MSADDQQNPDPEKPRDRPERDDGDRSRQSWLAAVPKRDIVRAVVLLGILAGILFLRGRTESIAGCMANAFRMPTTTAPQTAPSSTAVPAAGSIKVRLAPSLRIPDASAR
jgi:hypothetical protein